MITINKKKSIIYLYWKMKIIRMISIIIGSTLIIFVILVFFLRKFNINIISFLKNFLVTSFRSIKKKKDKSLKSSIDEKVELLLDKYNIKSTEKTNINLKYMVNSPSHFYFNTSKNFNIDNLNNYGVEIKKLLTDPMSKKIIKNFIYNKKIFIELFTEKNNNVIRNLETFYEFQIKNISRQNKIKYNVLLKFFTKNDYLYVFVNNNELIKIKKYKEYDQITGLLEKKDNIFLIEQNENIGGEGKYFITYGDYVSCKLDSTELKDIFFKNKQNDYKNYNLLTSFENIGIYFYVSTLIDK